MSISQPKAEQTARLTRRAAMVGAAVSSVAVVAPVAMAETPEPEHPWDKARRLGKELSETLTECSGGRWLALIFPDGHPHSVSFADLEYYESIRRLSDEQGQALDRWRDLNEQWEQQRAVYAGFKRPTRACSKVFDRWSEISKERDIALADLVRTLAGKAVS